jgi:carboxymethylenebutenolidase
VNTGREYVRLLFAFCVSLLVLPLSANAADPSTEVTIPAGKYQLHGCYWTPEAGGTHGVMIFNHGSEKNPAPCGPPDLAAFYLSQGYAFFTFQRHGHGASPGEYIVDLQRQEFAIHRGNPSAAQHKMIGLQELYNLDVQAAVAWLKQQPWADPSQLAMTGISFGGIQTLLTAEKGLGIKAFLPFAPAAQSWNAELAERLKHAVRQSTAPIFIAQAENDYSLEPSNVLGAELKKKGQPNNSKIYPPFGTTNQDGHWVFGSRRDGIAVWAPDVETFLAGAMR